MSDKKDLLKKLSNAVEQYLAAGDLEDELRELVLDGELELEEVLEEAAVTTSDRREELEKTLGEAYSAMEM